MAERYGVDQLTGRSACDRPDRTRGAHAPHRAASREQGSDTAR